MLAQALKVGHSSRYLRPLPASRRRHLRAEIIKDVAAVKKVVELNSLVSFSYAAVTSVLSGWDEGGVPTPDMAALAPFSLSNRTLYTLAL